MSCKGKTAIVTGAAGKGMGRSIAFACQLIGSRDPREIEKAPPMMAGADIEGWRKGAYE